MSKSNHHPDEFMFSQFLRHSRILTSNNRRNYFMLSGGANLFPMANVWKDLLKLELDNDLAYHWYTSQKGFPTVQTAAKIWEEFAASEGNIFASNFSSGVCMTIGATQAATIVFDYIAKRNTNAEILLVGMNYPLFERLSRYYKLTVHEIVSQDRFSTLPDVEIVIAKMSEYLPKLVVLTIPNNPSGETYYELELSKIFRTANCLGLIVLVDTVGELPISSDKWINVGKAIIESQSQSQVVIINSFSKTDSVPGFRIGYMMAPPRIIQHATDYQLNNTMNIFTVPAIPVFFSFLARCIFIGENLKWVTLPDKYDILNFFLRLFDVTTAIPPSSIFHEIKKRLDLSNFRYMYDSYIDHLMAIDQAIKLNYKYILKTLGNYISKYTKLKGGFNFLIELEPFIGKDEDKVSEDLFEKTGLAILTESCFRLNLSKNVKNFWIRISLASPTENFQQAIEKFKKYLDTH